MNPPVDLYAVWADHQASVLEGRGDEHLLHASDLHACDYATMKRLQGGETIPFNARDFGNFERGHAYENRVEIALNGLPMEFEFTHGSEIEYQGIVGHVDFWLYRRSRWMENVAIIDPRTTKHGLDWQYGHVLKSAFYTIATGCEMFCEWVFQIDYKGNISSHKPWWFHLDDIIEDGSGDTWLARVHQRIIQLHNIESGYFVPEPEPPVDPRNLKVEDWRCRDYCQAECPKNRRWK